MGFLDDITGLAKEMNNFKREINAIKTDVMSSVTADNAKKRIINTVKAQLDTPSDDSAKPVSPVVPEE